jgi:hypothetical protein
MKEKKVNMKTFPLKGKNKKKDAERFSFICSKHRQVGIV